MQEVLSKEKDEIDLIFANVQSSLKELAKPFVNKLTRNDLQTPKPKYNQDLIKTLIERKLDFEKGTGLKETSNIIEFAKFSELVKFILANREIFEKVFWNNPRSFDFLARLAHLEQKSYEDFSSNEKDEIIGMSWYVSKQMEEWEKGEETKVLGFSIDLSFDSKVGYHECLEQAKNWFSKLESKSTGISELVHPNLGDVCRLDYPEGSAYVTNPATFEVPFGGENLYSSRVRLMTMDLALLDLLIGIGSHSYWNISWTIKDDANLRSLNSVVNLLHDDIGDGFDNDFVNWGGIEYYLLDDPPIVINIMPGASNEFRMRLTKKNSYLDNGFLTAHKFFSPEIIYEIILKLREKSDIKFLIKNSLEK